MSVVCFENNGARNGTEKRNTRRTQKGAEDIERDVKDVKDGEEELD